MLPYGPSRVPVSAELVVAVVEADEHAGGRVGQLSRGHARVFHGLPGRFQQHAMLRVHGHGFFFRNGEELGVEIADVVHESAPLAVGATRYPGLGVVVLLDIPAVQRHLGDKVFAPQQRLPQLVR